MASRLREITSVTRWGTRGPAGVDGLAREIRRGSWGGRAGPMREKRPTWRVNLPGQCCPHSSGMSAERMLGKTPAKSKQFLATNRGSGGKETSSGTSGGLTIKWPHVPVDELREGPAVLFGGYQGIVQVLDDSAGSGGLTAEADRRSEAERINDHECKEAPSGPCEQPFSPRPQILIRVHRLSLRRARSGSSLARPSANARHSSRWGVLGTATGAQISDSARPR